MDGSAILPSPNLSYFPLNVTISIIKTNSASLIVNISIVEIWLDKNKAYKFEFG